MQRLILHIDMDAFYASVEQRDNPELRGKPLVVGGEPGGRGVVAACSYEARAYGIHSAMPSTLARRHCPHAVFVRPRFDVYKSVSSEIHGIFRRYTRHIEPLSLDEAYLDVSEGALDMEEARVIAQSIRSAIAAELHLTASAGISYNKFLAKLGSDMNKPDGLTVISEDSASQIIEVLPVRKFHGIGPSTEARMGRLGIVTGRDLRACSEELLVQEFGKAGRYYYRIARAQDERPVVSKRKRKSAGKETTFASDVLDKRKLWEAAKALTQAVFQRLTDSVLVAHTLTLKVRYSDFHSVTRSVSSDAGYETEESVLAALPELFRRTEAGRVPVRLLGVTLSGFRAEAEPTSQSPLQRTLDLQ